MVSVITIPLHFVNSLVCWERSTCNQEVAAGRFRQDLYFRLAVITIPLPPLRARPEDVPLLVDHFLSRHANSPLRHFTDLPNDVQQRLVQHAWPGNVRQLRNVVDRMQVLSPHQAIEETRKEGGASDNAAPSYDVQAPIKQARQQVIDAFEREYLARVLSLHEDNVTRAARHASVDRRHIYTLLTKHGLSPRDHDGGDD